MKESILIAILLVLIYIFFLKNKVELMAVNVKEELIYVRKKDDYNYSSQLLYELIQRMYRLREHLILTINNHGNMKDYVLLLKNNFSKERTHIYETEITSSYTSYNVNKGEEIVFCLRYKPSLKLHNINDLVYVAVHEMAHSGCPENGHTPLFNRIFKFYLEEAVKIGIYNYHNYSSSPLMYCGMMLNTQILNF